MNNQELMAALHYLKVQTGSLACLGCGHEHSCSTKGCAILREAIAELKKRPPVVHAHWELVNKYGMKRCSHCKCCDKPYYDRFCGNCGAIMDEEGSL